MINMKQLLNTLSIVALLGLGACSQAESPLDGSNEEVKVTFTAQLPQQAATRATGDGSGVDTLYCAVYQKTGESTYTFIKGEEGIKADNGFTYEPILLKNQTYKVAFWAMKSGSYTIDKNDNLQNIAISSTCNSDTADAFTGVSNDVVAGGTEPIAVELKRPFAQLNFFTTASDIANAKTLASLGEDATLQSTISLSSTEEIFYTAYNAWLQEGTGAATKSIECTTATNATLSEETISSETYKNLGYTYVLPIGDSELAKATLKVSSANKEVTYLEVNNVPLKRNQRTNVYGTLLTGTVKYTVSVSADWTTDGDINKTPEELNNSQNADN